jgi:hypothetical protein
MKAFFPTPIIKSGEFNIYNISFNSIYKLSMSSLYFIKYSFISSLSILLKIV